MTAGVETVAPEDVDRMLVPLTDGSRDINASWSRGRAVVGIVARRDSLRALRSSRSAES